MPPEKGYFTLGEGFARRELLPADLTSAEYRELVPREVRERAVFSARTYQVDYLRRMRDVLSAYANGLMNQGDARLALLMGLEEIGYSPAAEDADTIRDLSARTRLNLILKTNRAAAAGVALTREEPIARSLYPAWRFRRFSARKDPRDWQARWRSAGAAVAWQGASRQEMVARKDSPIWQALGDGAGNYADTLGNPYPPFAFNSGMGWEPVAAEEAARLGLESAPAAAQEATLSPSEAEIADRLAELPPDMRALLLGGLAV